MWDALQEADEALATFPRDGDLNVARARLVALRGDVAEAESCLIRQVRDGGGERSRKALEGLRAALEVIRRDNRRDARETNNREKTPRGFAEVIRRDRAAGPQAKRRGNSLYSSGDLDGAISAYSAGLIADAEGCVRNVLLANRAQATMLPSDGHNIAISPSPCLHVPQPCHRHVSQALLGAGRGTDAVADATAALRYDPRSVKLLLRRAACHVSLGDFGVARADYEKVAEIDPDCEQARAGIARCAAPRAGVGGGPGGPSAVIAEKIAEIDPYEVLGIERDATAAQVEPIIRIT